jgi:hypothetical protein
VLDSNQLGSGLFWLDLDPERAVAVRIANWSQTGIHVVAKSARSDKLILQLWMAYSKAVALKRLIFKRKKGSRSLIKALSQITIS